MPMPEKVLKTNLRALRLQKGLTQEKLANRVGVTRKTINVIEAGSYSPSVKLALLIAAVFEAKVEDLFYLSEE